MVVAASKPILAKCQCLGPRFDTITGSGSADCPGAALTLDRFDRSSAPGLVHHRASGNDLGCAVAAGCLYPHLRSNRLKYAVLGVLFVNVSIGGTLTPMQHRPF